MLEDLIKEEEEFQNYLADNYYTFIGPVDQNLMEEFLRTANELAPIQGFSRRLYHVLTHKPSVLHACHSLPRNTEFRIYVTEISDLPMLLHSTTEEYCKKHDIKIE